MPKLRRLSGKDLVSFCESYNFTVSRQKGSHMNLVRVVTDKKQIVTIPNHKEIDRGTLHSIYKKLASYIPESDLEKFFYTE